MPGTLLLTTVHRVEFLKSENSGTKVGGSKMKSGSAILGNQRMKRLGLVEEVHQHSQ